MLQLALPATVDLLAMHRRFPSRYPFLLQSVAAHPQAGRYDILFAGPESAIEARAGDADFFERLDQAAAQLPRLASSEFPFAGGWFLLLGYEAARWAEPRLRLPASPYALPDALAVRCSAAVIVDRLLGAVTAISESSEALLAQLAQDSAASAVCPSMPAQPPPVELCEDDEPRFLTGVERVLDYLQAGDVFQANLSRRWQARYAQPVDAVALYEQLRKANPAPFAGLASWGGSTVLSSSPERLIEVADGIAQTRPIAGTHARDRADDERDRERLIASLKERAEHVMLIDLERNDLGRIAVPGSVEVSELMTIESYAHVHHIVSNVRARLRDGVGPGAALRAVFPGGTITGAPKVRAMEIIAELEGVGRGPYTGAMGYLSRCGRLDTNILIRTLVCEGNTVSFRAGAGIVADSRPHAELAETRAKARGLLLALGAVA
ncbi:MAG: aminodeoxychorismate synthase component I [Gammaproteobacteria bacterium]|nr:aminodeoxychorismate synthase component I [Gammaproteobacteria bacterium]